ncbi:hypothetical protein [Ascidiimonas aurantiaca]|uniref:hypothetical protein n=1 Tax=Ascidiimonas aurantiaca TaxID=1685432 RepID=UPI0030EB6224
MNEKPLNRDTLKSIFSNGSRPDANNFASLIDSMINKVDDGISKNLEDGLILSPEGKESDRLVSFYEKIQDNLPRWSIELVQQEGQGLGIIEPVSEEETPTRLFFQKGGNVGVNTTKPATTLEVNGILGASSRVGTYKMDTIPADGQWHDIVTNLDGCNAFEIVAQVGKEKKGKYALLQANALSTFGRSRSKIRTVQAHYGWWWNKLSLRWRGSTFNYSLQLRTRSNYGADEHIKFYVTKLWDNDIMSLFNK